MSSPKQKWLSSSEEQEIIAAIQEAEKESSGELRVHLESRCKSKSPLDRAVKVFYKLGMDKTAARNGILIYISVEDRKLAIIGDKGIHQYTGDALWEEIRLKMITRIQQVNLSSGICLGIQSCSAILSQYFPYNPGDINELPNEISISD